MPTSRTPLPPGLRDGYRRFRSTRYPEERERFSQLHAQGQRPSAMVVACADSRSAPETVFDAGPGELFVVRNVGALVPAYEPDGRNHAASAALEYAVRGLGVTAILVMGHGRCGGVRAAVDASYGPSSSDFVGRWVAGIRLVAASMDRTTHADEAAFLGAVEHRSIERSVENLHTFPWIEAQARSGRLRLDGAWFDIGLGELDVLTPGGWLRVADD
jgi:carbonic anhydrase